MKPRGTGRAYCGVCSKEVDFHIEDWGIGAYEFWGAKGTHHDYIAVCDECGEQILDKELEFDDREPEWEPDLNEDDWREDR